MNLAKLPSEIHEIITDIPINLLTFIVLPGKMGKIDDVSGEYIVNCNGGFGVEAEGTMTCEILPYSCGEI